MADVRLIHGTGERMEGVADASAALALTGPPYFPAEVEPQLRAGRLSSDAVAALRVKIEEFAWTLRPVLDECWRVILPGGRLILQTRDVRLGHSLVPVESVHRHMAEATGMKLFTRHHWRPRFTTRGRRQLATALAGVIGPAPIDPEVFLVFCKPGPARPGEPTEADVQLLQADALSTPAGRLPSAHPFQSPIPVLDALIRSHSRVGDLVVDPFCGGGTILSAASRLGRAAWGCDINRSALALARTNLKLAPEMSP
jgi:modification methylase